MSIKPFKSITPWEVIDNLKLRLKLTRWPDEMQNSGWTYGTNLSYLKELSNYWRDHFDWRKTEEEINSWPNFIAEIYGYKIHFLRIKGKGKKTFPLIITHGWPGSFLEMMKIIPLLTTDPDFSFDLVIPSLIGFGFSEKVTKPGCNRLLIADLWKKLMSELGYEKFGVQGGDIGAVVSTTLALNYPENVLGIHLNYIPGSYKPFLKNGKKFTEEESEFQKNVAEWSFKEGSYWHQHVTKPATLAYGLNDSPVGLCAWILEKFYGWSDCDGNIGNIFTKDELLSNITLYWITQTIHSSIRIYNENSKVPLAFNENTFVSQPVGIAKFPKEIGFPPRSYIERGYNVQHWSEFPAGGHFAAMEQPVLLSKDIKDFFKGIV